VAGRADTVPAMNEKKEFSERLRAAMKAQKLEVSGAVLEREFNLHWSGTPVRRQTAWKWLNGEAIPTQDKLQELARRLKLDPHRLRLANMYKPICAPSNNAGMKVSAIWSGILSMRFSNSQPPNAN